MTDTEATAPPASLAELSSRLADDVRDLDVEVTELDLLVEQARTEAGRHSGRREAVTDKLKSAGMAGADPAERLELTTQLVNLTKRAALMESQVDVLEGKRRALGRYRETVAAYAVAVEAMVEMQRSDAEALSVLDPSAPMPPAVSRMILSAQEDLRREIARAMHDGPAQSLTNIVLQAQIVELLVTRDPSSAQGELTQLIAMVQQTLEATKTFIFDVRPMVLDDLGLLPTLRRAAREHGHRAGVSVDFDSIGQDRRLSMELESGLFRMVDEALAAYVAQAPDRVSLTLEWTDGIEIRLAAGRTIVEPTPAVVERDDPSPKKGDKDRSDDLPPALAAMIEQRQADERRKVEAARIAALVTLPPVVWREIQTRATSIGVAAETHDEGSQLVLTSGGPSTPG